MPTQQLKNSEQTSEPGGKGPVQNSVDKLTCIFTNVEALTNKMSELQHMVKHQKPHIIGISEVLPKFFRYKIYPEEFFLENYEMIPHPNVANNIGRGSVLYIHKSILYTDIKFDIDPEFEEGIYVEIKLKNNDSLLCANIYRRGESTKVVIRTQGKWSCSTK